ncbi:hypothetical protein EDD18DRAFT_1358145 [Armillaria luteobubalina]|uniref:Uncharacterized protein n=1 Tax=Armillaria luteobubalina TaxID=153913 RepID=A0AA39PZQ9_9AGAR|nr:hypothetical protein EDD18DRAFT_1358145 [Armillaria luteobubalina]
MFSKFIKEPSLCDPSLPPSLRTLAAVIRFLLHRFPPSEFNLPRATIWWPLRVAISVIPHRTSYQEATAVITMLEDIIISCTIESLNITPDWDDLCNVTIRTYQYLATIAPSAYSLHGVRSMIEFMTIHWDQQWRSGPACAALTNLLAKRIPVAFLAFLESQCLQFLGSHTFHEESVPVVREYVAGIFTWHHPSDGAVDESTLQAHVEYLHDPHNLFTTCSILATQGFKSTDRTAIHRDIMALVQLSPRDAAWGECHKKLCDLVQDDGADFFAEQRVRESDGDVRPLRIDEIQAEKANIRYAIQVLDDFFDGRAHTSIAHLDHFLARWLRRKPEDKPEQEQPV